MSRSVLGALRALLLVLFAGSLGAQVGSWLIAGAVAGGALAVVVVILIVAGALCVEVVLLSVWMLVAMIRQGALFDDRGHADRWVNAAIGALMAAAVVSAGGAVALVVQAAERGAWGLALLAAAACGASAALALLVVVMRRLLHTAISLRSELAEVI